MSALKSYCVNRKADTLSWPRWGSHWKEPCRRCARRHRTSSDEQDAVFLPVARCEHETLAIDRYSRNGSASEVPPYPRAARVRQGRPDRDRWDT